MAQQQEATETPFNPQQLGVDDFYFSALFDHDDQPHLDDPISDDKYAEELQLQETLVASIFILSSSSSSSSSSPCIASSSSSSPCIASSSKTVGFSLVVIPRTEFVTEEEEGASDTDSSSLIFCEICTDAKEAHQMFRNMLCGHSFCSECVTKQVATKIQESITVVPCPGLNCRAVLDVDACRILLPKDVLDRWNDALCEAHFLAVPKFYCPFRDCSAMMLVDNGMEEIRESECPFCHRLFCARCNVPWHPGVTCEVFQTLNEDERGREDLLVKELVNQKQWSRCPQCKFYVEKIDGCLHITCRCKFEFCYKCGKPWTSTHGGC